MTGLFSMIELEAGQPDRLPGCRLQRLEVFNWGTFDQRVWVFEVGGRNALLTGDIGSGKSTLVDAITTLLLPAQKISYNKAAGADTRERDLRSYVLGHYKSERNETTGASRSVGLRDDRQFSVLLGVFANTDFDTTLTLAQVFRQKDVNQGQPDRFYVVAQEDLSITKHFSDFGSDFTGLKKRLRGDGALVRDSFPDYGREFRRQLGIDSEQAMDLFHQTVSMKAVDNLNDFVRSHMLEPFDTKDRVTALVGHFDDLTSAHDAVLRARTQLELLTPIVDDLDVHDELGNQLADLEQQQAAAPYFFADRKRVLLGARLEELAGQIAGLERELASRDGSIRSLRRRASDLDVEIAGHGGERLAEIQRSIDRLGQEKPNREDKFRRFNGLLAEVGLDRVAAAEQFEARQDQANARRSELEKQQADLQNELTDLRVTRKQVDDEALEVNTELHSLQSRRSNLPKLSLDLRDRLRAELKIDEADLPFAGELIQVRADSLDWEGAAERVLHGFALSLLVPNRHYDRVAAWIDRHHLGARLVYYRIPATAGPRRELTRGAHDQHLVDKLEVRPESLFADWLQSELNRRADHACVVDTSAFNSVVKAVTRAGQIKDRDRHEKDDRRRIDDRMTYVLGWSNEQKIAALIERATTLQSKLSMLDKAIADTGGRERSIAGQLQSISGLAQYASWNELDWMDLVNKIAALQAEHAQLTSSSNVLATLTAQRAQVEAEIKDLESKINDLREQLGGVRSLRSTAQNDLAQVEMLLGNSLAIDHASAAFESLDGLVLSEFDGRLIDAAAVVGVEQEVMATLTSATTKVRSRQSTIAIRIARAMTLFRGQYPHETTEFDDTLGSAFEYRQLHERVSKDDLPRFEREFKDSLNKNTIREIAGFSAQLHKHESQIRERVGTINQSLTEIDYNPGRYIRLVPDRTPNTEVREFIAELTACTVDMVGVRDDNQYSEARFLQVKRIIDRFKGREGMTDQDRAWTGRVTDVRQWFVFSASERWREDDSEYENYADSAGKSGGQKEKLAYTILAASLAYQFKLDWGAARSRSFRFVVIDEAFGRGSEASTRYALSLFTRLGLQLLIVTPLQKIHVIEPHVSAVGFVDNPDGSYSRLQGLTIEEFHRERALRGAPSTKDSAE
ncbi:MAG: ATP-binding protein [Acidimicrobiales bacterium]